MNQIFVYFFKVPKIRKNREIETGIETLFTEYKSDLKAAKICSNMKILKIVSFIFCVK